MGYQYQFLSVIPLLWVGCIRVTHPSAGRRQLKQASISLPLDLHVLSLPLAFILSQDQTLHCKKCFVKSLALSQRYCLKSLRRVDKLQLLKYFKEHRSYIAIKNFLFFQSPAGLVGPSVNRPSFQWESGAKVIPFFETSKSFSMFFSNPESDRIFERTLLRLEFQTLVGFSLKAGAKISTFLAFLQTF